MPYFWKSALRKSLNKESLIKPALLSTPRLFLSFFIFGCSPADRSVIATIANNIPSSRLEQNLLEARKKLKAALQVESSKLTSRQRRTLLLNQVI